MNFSDIQFLDQYPGWVRVLLGAILVLVLIFTLALIFFRNQPDAASGEPTAATLPDVPLGDLAAYEGFIGTHPNSFLLASGVDDLAYFDSNSSSTVFSRYLLEGLNGTADSDRNGVITLVELRSFLDERIRAHGTSTLRKGLRPPVFFFHGPSDTPFIGTIVPYDDAVGLTIGISDYDNGRDFAGAGANAFADLMRDKVSINTNVLFGGVAVEGVRAEMKRLLPFITPNDLLVIYFAGRTLIDTKTGATSLMLYSPGKVESISATEVADFVAKAGAKFTVVFLDCARDTFYKYESAP